MPMRVLFLLHSPENVRYFESMLDALADRGHEVHVAVSELTHRRLERRRGRPADRRARDRVRDRGDDLISALSRRHAGITRGVAPVRQDRWTDLADWLRRGVDYLRVLEPAYDNAPKLRARQAGKAPGLVRRVSGWPLMRGRRGRALLDRLLRALDRAVPESPDVVGFLARQRPQAVIVTPLLNRHWQLDYVRAARSLGLHSALCVASWDNLTNKGLIQEAPERVYVWNDYQRREAVEMHRLPAERVVATGAQCFDQWFERRPSRASEEFRQRLGFDAHSPILLYVCSYHFIAPDEPRFVQRWIAALRAHGDERLRTANLLVRPYPDSRVSWENHPVADLPQVTIWPAGGALPTDEDSKSGYYDSLFHSSAVVGINTSALVEAPIVGRRVFTVLDRDFQDTQEGTLHFHYLMREHGGPLTVGRDMGEHLDQLAQALGEDDADDQARRFVARFLRPRGWTGPPCPS